MVGCVGPRDQQRLTCRLGFEQRTEVANWVNVAALLSSTFLLLSFALLDTKWTHRHYLSICLTASVVFIEVGVVHDFPCVY